jgi:L-ribulose-5-phosphate 3-epimerase
MLHNDISLAQWALVEEFHSKEFSTLDFPRIARKDFNLNGIEFVNTLFDNPTAAWIDKLKNQAKEHDVQMLLIMVDDEGDGCSSSPQGRKQFAINHRKWVDIAAYLGCTSIRTNCCGEEQVDKETALGYAEESYQLLLNYAGSYGINILIENHGGVSNDPVWMVELEKRINHPLFGSYPDWREPADDFDNLQYLKSVLPFAKGMSYRNQPTEALTAEMINLCEQSGYRGWYGIESYGREAVKLGISFLQKYLSTKSS